MEKKLITLVLIALLVGLGGGYGLGYVVHQPQILSGNVTKWLHSQPKTLFYGQYNLSWSRYWVAMPTCIRGGGMLDIGDYTRICIFLKFYNWTVEYGQATWAVTCMWSPYSNYTCVLFPSEDTICAYERLESLNCTITENTIYACKLETLKVKAPYVELSPTHIEIDNSEGTALCSIIVFLTYD